MVVICWFSDFYLNPLAHSTLAHTDARYYNTERKTQSAKKLKEYV